jgi:hypothetical protein
LNKDTSAVHRTFLHMRSFAVINNVKMDLSRGLAMELLKYVCRIDASWELTLA